MERRPRHTDEERQEILRKFDELTTGGMKREEACREVGVSGNTIISWRRKLEQPGPAREIVKVDRNGEKMLKAENLRLRNICVDLMLDVQSLKEFYAKK